MRGDILILENPWPQFHKDVDWQTPPDIVKALGKFDLDPCAAPRQFYKTARVMWTKRDKGLEREWPAGARVWLNPPYDRYTLGRTMQKMAEHNNGIALVPVKFASKWFQDWVADKAHSLLFLKKR